MNVAQAISNGWTEVKEPTLFNFTKIGEWIIGTLLDLRFEKITDNNEKKDVLTARLELENGEQVKLRPSYDLRQKLGKRHIGRRMMIVFDSEDAATEGKGNKMKIFRVLLAPTADAEPPYAASDADLDARI